MSMKHYFDMQQVPDKLWSDISHKLKENTHHTRRKLWSPLIVGALILLILGVGIFEINLYLEYQDLNEYLVETMLEESSNNNFMQE